MSHTKYITRRRNKASKSVLQECSGESAKYSKGLRLCDCLQHTSYLRYKSCIFKNWKRKVVGPLKCSYQSRCAQSVVCFSTVVQQSTAWHRHIYVQRWARKVAKAWHGPWPAKVGAGSGPTPRLASPARKVFLEQVGGKVSTTVNLHAPKVH